MADIITYPENGITYDADDASGFLATRYSGVYSAEEDFAVTPNGDLTVTVSAGQAWVRPQRFRGRSIIMEQPETLTLTAADAVRTRIDRIVLRYDAAAKKTSLQVLEGTPDSSSPTAPEISRTALIYDLSLATIRRPACSTAITAAHITDTRTDEAVCGVMRDGVTGIPTGTLVQQWLAVLESMKGGSFYTRAEVDALLAKLNVCPFEVGDVLHTTSSVSPAARFGGTWEEIATNRVLMGASSSHAAGTTAEAGLPNITGTIGQIPNNDYVGNWQSIYANGAFSAADDRALNYPDSGSRDTAKITFDASKSSAVYGRSSTVQPAAYYVHIWQRKA